MEIPEGYTAEEWEGLSETEREGILDSINNPEGEEAPDDDMSPEDLAKIADEGEGDPPPADTPADTPADNNKPDDESSPVADDVLLVFKPVITDADIVLDEVVPPELKTKLDELKADFDEGEMSIHDYTEARDKINRQLYKHNAALEEQARNDAVWKKEQLYFLKHKPEYLPGNQTEVTGKIRANALFGALNETVKTLSQDEANAHLTGMQILVKADGIVKEAFGIVKKDKPKDDPPPERKPAAPLPDHKTLSDIPAAGKNDTVDDVFAQLDKVPGDKYEEALERLDPKIREAYLDRT